jgi:hypothetical protein
MPEGGEQAVAQACDRVGTTEARGLKSSDYSGSFTREFSLKPWPISADLRDIQERCTQAVPRYDHLRVRLAWPPRDTYEVLRFIERSTR